MRTLDEALSAFLKTEKRDGTYAALARRLGLAESTVYRLISRQQSATLARVEQILRALGKSPHEVFGAEITRQRTRRG